MLYAPTFILQESYAQAYRPLLNHLLEYGEPVSTRGRPTLESLNVLTVILNPRQRLAVVPGRELNPFLALSECLWMLAGRDDLAGLLPYNKGMAEYSDDGVHLYGAYGKRIADQIDPLLARLRADPTDRRAVLSIWHGPDCADSDNGPQVCCNPTGPGSDLTAETKDPPCNNLLYLKLRGGALHMTVVCRSNDLHWGLMGVNGPQFSFLLEYLAHRLGVEIGTITHLSNSLHVYTDDKGTAITKRMFERMGEETVKLPECPLFSTERYLANADHTVWAGTASLALDQPISAGGDHFFEFASDYLALYRSKGRYYTAAQVMGCRHSEHYLDWVVAAREFRKEKPRGSV